MSARTVTPITAAAAVVVAAAGAALAGCSGGSPEPLASVEPGPIDQLSDLLGLGDGGATAEVRIQERVSACMAAAGFEYVPVQDALDLELADPEEEQGTREFAERWGYGATTDPYGQAAALAAATDPPDPNAAIVEAMSDAERAEYVLALWGPATEEDDPADWRRQGCQGLARHEVEVEQSALGPGIETFLRGARESWASAYADARVADAAADWSSCMADAGYPDLATPEAAAELAFARADAAVDDAALAEVREREIAMAIADVECQADAQYRIVLASAVAEYQREFYESNRTELDALWDAARELAAGR